MTTVRDLGDIGFRTLHHRDHPVDGLPRILAAGPPLTTVEGHCHFLGGVAEGPKPSAQRSTSTPGAAST